MTILASGPNIIVCGSLALGIHRRPGRRLTSELVKWVGTPYSECPDSVLGKFSSWLCSGPDGWAGAAFECFDIEEEFERRALYRFETFGDFCKQPVLTRRW